MAVLAEMYSVVVRVQTLNRRYPGGVDAYEANCPNSSFCSDGEVCRIGFMPWADVQSCLESLKRFDITIKSGEVAIVREDKGVLLASDWLEFHCVDGTPMCRRVDSKVQFMVAPPGWAPGHRNILMTEAELRQRELVSGENGVDSCRDPSTAEVLHVGRSSVPSSRRPWWKFWS